MGTAALAVLDDIGRWGTRWRDTLQKFPALLAAVEDVVGVIAEDIAPRNSLRGTQGAVWVVKRLEPVGAFFYAIASDPKDSATRLSWERLEQIWCTAFDWCVVDPQLRARLASPKQSGERSELTTSIQRLGQVLESLSGETSMTRGKHIAEVRVRLQTLPQPVDEVWDAFETIAREGEGPLVRSAAIGIWVAIQGMLDALEIVAKEADSGMPHPGRESTLWADPEQM